MSNVNEHISYRIARLVHGLICRKNRNEGCTSIFGWQLRGRDLSKITDLLAIPIGFLAIKALQGKVKDEEEVKPIIKADPFVTPLDIGPIQVGNLLLGGTPTPEGTPEPLIKDAVPFGTGTDIVPFFPETAADFKPSNGTSDITKLKDFEYNIPKSFDPWWLK